MTNSLPRTGVAPMLAALPMGGFKVTGMADGAADTDAATVGQVGAAFGTKVSAATSKATPVDADYLPLYDSAASNALRKLTWVNLKAALQKFVSTAAGTIFTLESSDAGAASGPDVDLYRSSASPAASDVLSSLLFNGKDSAGNKELYATIRTILKSPTSTSEAAEIVLRTIAAGALADRLHIGAGAYMEGASGGDPGAGKFNATQLQQNGVAIPFSKKFTSAEQTITSSGDLSIAHGLGVRPDLIQARLICKSAEAGFPVGDEIVINPGMAYVNGTMGAAISVSATNILVGYSNFAKVFATPPKTGGAYVELTNSSWRLVLRAWA